MFRTILIAIVLAATFSDVCARTCFDRGFATAEGANGSTYGCSSGLSCYSYSQDKNGGRRFAYCGTCTGKSQYPDCYECTTELCNSLTPSSISCYFRYGANRSSNGTERICHTGVTQCYTYFENSLEYASCGPCLAANPSNCLTCSTSYCNIVRPSTISCHVRNGSNANTTDSGESVDCEPLVTSCHSYKNGTSLYANCGNCTSDQVSSHNCTSCGTTNCNYVPVSSISCYTRAGSNSSSNGTMTACGHGIFSCYYYNDGWSQYANCGNCTSAQTSTFGCRTCNTPGCNPAAVSTISCHVRNGSNSTSNGASTACVPGISSCYSYVDGWSQYANCGTCTLAQTSSFGCSSCSTTGCNPALMSTISCHVRNGSNSTSNAATTACRPGISSCYSYVDGWSQYANCGTCTSAQTSSFGCRSCSTTGCNPALVSTISCHVRTGSNSSSNGTVEACTPGISSCRSYEDTSLSHAACGVCTATQVSNFGCTSCNTTSCNYKRVTQNPPKSAQIAGVSVKTTVLGILLLTVMKFF